MDVITVFWVMIIYCMLLTLIVVYMFTQTPAKFFLQAKLFKKSLLLKKIKGIRAIQFEPAKQRTSGALKARSGIYYKTADSGFYIQPGNIPGFIVPASIGHTIKIELLELLSALKDKFGKYPEDYDELKGMVKEYNKNKEDPNAPLKIPSFATIAPHDLDNLFKENMNVDQQETLIGLEKHKARLSDKLNMQHAMIIFIIMIGVGVGVFLINKALTGNACPACSCVLNTIQNVTSTPPGVIVG